MIERTNESIRPVDLLAALKRTKPLDTPTITPEDLRQASQPVEWALRQLQNQPQVHRSIRQIDVELANGALENMDVEYRKEPTK